MLGLLAQSSYTYTTTTTSNEDAAAAFGAMTMILALIFLPILIFTIVCMWKVFEKAGVAGWKAIIPFYNSWVLAEIAGKPGWWGIIGLTGIIPVVGFIGSIAALVLYVIIAIELSKKFGKDGAFAIVLVIFSVIGYAILAFGDAKYQGAVPAATASPTPTPPATTPPTTPAPTA